MYKFRVGDIANGQETSEEIIEAKDELSALKQLVNDSNLYCEEVEDVNEMTKEQLIEYLVEEYKDFLKTSDFDYVKRIANSSKFDIRP